MPKSLAVRSETWPIRGSFRIARGAKTAADVVVVEIADDRATGRGECVPYPRYGETTAGVIAEIETLRSDIADGLSRAELQQRLKPGAARNAIDCALLDWDAKATGKSAAELLGLPAPLPVRTAYTLSLDTPDAMAQAAKHASQTYRLLKLKIAGAGDLERVEAVRRAAPSAILIADANEGWSVDDLHRLTPELARLGVALDRAAAESRRGRGASWIRRARCRCARMRAVTRVPISCASSDATAISTSSWTRRAA